MCMTAEQVIHEMVDSFSEFLASKGETLEGTLSKSRIDDNFEICTICREPLFSVTIEAPVGNVLITNIGDHQGCIQLEKEFLDFADSVRILHILFGDQVGEIMSDTFVILKARFKEENGE